MPERSLVLEMRHITKRFPGIVANDDIGFDLREGEVHALLGAVHAPVEANLSLLATQGNFTQNCADRIELLLDFPLHSLEV